MRNLLSRLRAVHISAVAVLVAAGVTVSVVVGGGKPSHIEIQIGGPHGTPTATLEVPAAAVAAAADVAEHQGMRDETPVGAPPAVIEAAREQQDALAANDQLPIVTPDAAPEQRGCRTQLVQDYSSRRGVRPRIFVLHYTVSANVAGWDDVNAIVGLFDRPAFAASSNYVLDREGHCAYIVRESDKAWTQAALNPVSISVEVINTGHDPSYIGHGAGLAKLAEIVSDATKRWEIPLQAGEVSGGVVKRAGIVDHGMLGVAGGGHHDIAPYSVDQVLAAAKAFRAAHTSKPKPKPKPLPRCTVKQLQRALNAHGAHLDVDGVRGPRTAAALTRVGFTSLKLSCRP